MRLLCDKCGRKAIPPQRLRGQGELMCRRHFFTGKKCVTILDFVCWPETMTGKRNVLAAPKAEDILEKLSEEQRIEEGYQPFGDGHCAGKIVRMLEKTL